MQDAVDTADAIVQALHGEILYRAVGSHTIALAHKAHDAARIAAGDLDVGGIRTVALYGASGDGTVSLPHNAAHIPPAGNPDAAGHMDIGDDGTAGLRITQDGAHAERALNIHILQSHILQCGGAGTCEQTYAIVGRRIFQPAGDLQVGNGMSITVKNAGKSFPSACAADRHPLLIS